MPKPLIIILSLEQDEHFRSIHSHLRDTLIQKANIREVNTPDQARRALNSTIRPHAVIVADPFITKHAYRDIIFQLVDFAKAGGTVIYAGCLSSFVGPLDLSAHFETVWNLPWRFGQYYRAEFITNPSSTTGVHLPQLAQKYSIKTVFLDNVKCEDALYIEECDIDGLKTKRASGAKFKTTATFTVIGAGRFGFVGDVNGESGTTVLVLAMCLYPGSRTPASLGTGVPAPGSTGNDLNETHARGPTTAPSHNKRVTVLALQNKRKLQEDHSQIFSGLTRNASMTVVRDADIAATTVSTLPRPGDVVLLTDGAICEPAHTTLLYKLILFAHEGATVCQFGHAPDSRSVRDELCGQERLSLLAVGECLPTAKGGNCGYAHDATYLPTKGWWMDTKRLARLHKEFDAAVERMPLSGTGKAREKVLGTASCVMAERLVGDGAQQCRGERRKRE